MVSKKDGLWRPCGNYRHLNLVTTPDKYPLPKMQDLSNSLHSCTIFSKIDLVKGDHQIPVVRLVTEAISKTAIITRFVLFEYLFNPLSCSTTAPTRSCAAAPTPSPAESGRRIRWLLQPLSGLHSSGRHAWHPASPWQTAGLAHRQPCRKQAGLVFRPTGFFTFLFCGAAMRPSRNRFPTRRGGFCMPGTGDAFTASTETVPVPSMSTAPEVGPLTSSPPS